jgi:hypothetical protein
MRSLASDRTDVALVAVFLLGASFYFWRATYAEPLALHGGQASPYNQLADAFLHFRLWVVNVPAQALGPGNPYNPAQRSAFLSGYPDYALYGHYLYLTWGPAPVLVLLVPLHLLGLEPSASVVTTPYAIVGLGFALAALRVILRQIGDVRLWMCVLAALTLACASVIPYIVRFPLVYHEEIVGGWCFVMVAIWCGVSAVAERRGSLKRLMLMSLCVGLATATRPTLALTALLLVVVYRSLRSTRPRRGLLVALVAPFGMCVLLLAAYNQARFHNPLQYGAIYQINGISTYTAHFGDLSFVAPGLWAYLIAPPRLSVIFPFLTIVYPQLSYPLSVPAHYAPLSEETGGLIAMAPIASFLVALPWIWRRRPAALGPLSPFMLVMAGAGIACMILVSYEIYTTTERYEADYMSLLLFGGLSAWLVLSSEASGRSRRLVRAGGGLLAAWSCVIGIAIAMQEIEKHPGTWRTFVDIGSPLSTAIAALAGHPVLAEVYTPNLKVGSPSYSNTGIGENIFFLTARDQADLTIVSPEGGEDALVATTFAGPAAATGASPRIRLSGPGHASHIYQLAHGTARSQIPVHLHRGVNEIVLSAASGTRAQSAMLEREPESQALITFSDMTVARRR